MAKHSNLVSYEALVNDDRDHLNERVSAACEGV